MNKGGEGTPRVAQDIKLFWGNLYQPTALTGGIANQNQRELREEKQIVGNRKKNPWE